MDGGGPASDILRQPKGIFRGGLWEYSRHPNLFFELMVWIGFGFAGISNGEWESLLAFVAPLLLFLIMNYLTVPITEKYIKDTRPEFDDYCSKTNKYIPFIHIPWC